MKKMKKHWNMLDFFTLKNWKKWKNVAKNENLEILEKIFAKNFWFLCFKSLILTNLLSKFWKNKKIWKNLKKNQKFWKKNEKKPKNKKYWKYAWFLYFWKKQKMKKMKKI